MANRFSKYVAPTENEPQSNSNRFAKYLPQQQPVREESQGRGITGVAKDLGVSAAGGAANVVKAAGDIYGVVTGDYDNAASRAGTAGREYFNERKSPELQALEQARQEKIEAAETELGKAGVALWETIKSPSLWSSFLAEQAPMLLPVGAAGRATGSVAGRIASNQIAGRAAARGMSEEATERAVNRFAGQTASRAGTAGAVATGAAMHGSESGSSTYDELLDLPDEIWQENDDLQRLMADGLPFEDAKVALAERYSRQAAFGAGAVSVLTNMLPGARILESRLAGNRLTGSTTGNVVRGFLGETAQEGLEEGTGTVSTNLAVGNVDPDREWQEGVGEAVGMGAAAGPFGAVAGATNRRPQPAPSAIRVQNNPEPEPSEEVDSQPDSPNQDGSIDMITPAEYDPAPDMIEPAPYRPLRAVMNPQEQEAFDLLERERQEQMERDYEAALQQRSEQEITRANEETAKQEIIQRYTPEAAPTNPAMANALLGAYIRNTPTAIDTGETDIEASNNEFQQRSNQSAVRPAPSTPDPAVDRAPMDPRIQRLQAIRKEYESAYDRGSLNDTLAAVEKANAEIDAFAKESVEAGTAPFYRSTAGDMYFSVTPSTRQPGKYQITTFNDTGALGDTVVNSLDEVHKEINGAHADPVPAAEAEQIMARLAKAEAEYQQRRAAFEQAQQAPAAETAPQPARALIAADQADIERRAVEAERQAKLAKRRRVDTENDTIVRAAIKLGGIKPQWKEDITGDTKGNTNVPGVGFLFTDRGTSIDDMATKLHEAGYIPDSEMQNLGGVPWLNERLGNELAGRGKTYSLSSSKAVDEILAARDEQMEIEREMLASQREAEYAAIEAEYGPEAAELARQYDEDMDNINEDLSSEADYYEQQLQQREETAQARLDESLTDAEAAARDEQLRQADDQESRQPAEAGRRAQAAPEPDQLTLVQQSESERAQAESQTKARQQAEDQKRAQDRAKAEADAERDDFRLSGSKAPADTANSYGQNDMFTATRGSQKAQKAVVVTPSEGWTDSLQETRKLANQLIEAGVLTRSELDPIWGEKGPLAARTLKALQDYRKAENKTPGDAVAAAAAEVDTDPTEAQKEAGNYRKGHVSIQGLNISIENPRGSTRSGTDPQGKRWENTMAHHYGYIKRTEGADGEQVDVFIGETPDSEQVFVIDQINPDNTFDEHKVMIGFESQADAVAGYKSNYSRGWKVGPVSSITMAEFKAWLADGNNAKPFSNKVIAKNKRPEKPKKAPQPAASQEAVSVSEEPKSAVDQHLAFVGKMSDGEVTQKEYIEAFDSLVAARETVINELSSKTKDVLLKMLPPMKAIRYKSEKKDSVVTSTYTDMLDDFMPPTSKGGMFSYTPKFGGDYIQNHIDAIRPKIEQVTQQDLDDYAKRVSDARQKRAKAKREALAGMENPQTLDDFVNIIRHKNQEEGMSIKDARLSLTPDQRARFDELYAQHNRSQRNYRTDQARTAVPENTVKTGAEIIATKHTRDNYDLFVVQAADRVARETYLQWLSAAKKLGGWYSKFKGNGAVPGFQFKTREAAEAFQQYVSEGDSASIRDQAQVKRDALKDDRSQSAVQRLREMGGNLNARAEAALNQDRKTNTARRAGMAARAERAAEADKATAATMLKIADAIEAGEAQFLDSVRTKAQVDMLETMISVAHSEQMRQKYPSYSEREKHNDERPDIETADFAEYPSFTLYRSDWAKLGRQLSETEGGKTLGKKILSVADDVTKAYLKFANDNLTDVTAFRKADGSLPAFKSKADAEESIRRSGYRGKAIVLPVKRGENLIVLSPSEAQKRGIWAGDNDARITLRREFVDEILGKMRQKGIDVPWQLETANEKLKRLSSMGIESAPEFRAALREFIALQEVPKAPDRIKEMERAMIGRKKDGLDFFPTPASIADEMVETAGIEDGMTVLEPSAGMGHIAERIREAGVEPDVVEFSADRRELLEAKGFNVVGNDFLEVDGKYDRIIMNPPFSNRRDAEHVKHAYSLLNPGGKIVAIMGEGVFFGSDKTANEFRGWLESVGGTDEKLPEGAFMDASLPVNTGVNARMVVIEKSESQEDVRFSRSPSPETQAFKRWFADSKVVDAQGNPLVVYHGSPDARFVNQDGIFKGEFERYGMGEKGGAFWFAKDRATAATYADDRRAFDYQNAEAGVVSAYLSLQNPLVIDGLGKTWREAQQRGKTSDVIQQAREEGHDGVIIKNVLDNYSNFEGNRKGRTTDTYVVFSSTQIKSVDNSGAFDPENPDIRMSRTSDGVSIPATKAKALVSAITSRFQNAPDVIVVQSMQDQQVPEAVRREDAKQRSQGASGDPEGFYYQGKAYIVLDGLTKRSGESDAEALFRVFAHEVLGHAGLRGLFRSDLAKVLNEVAIKRRDDMRRKANEYGLKLSDQNDRMIAAEEILAEMAQTNPTNSLVVRAVEAIRQALRKLFSLLPRSVQDSLGNNAFADWITGMSDAEIINRFIVPAREYIRGGQADPASDAVPAFQRAYHGTPYRFDRFSLDAIGTGEGAQAYGWGLYFAGKREVAEFYRDMVVGNNNDLFDHYDQLSPEALAVYDEYSARLEDDPDLANEFREKMEEVGYTFDTNMYGEPTGLRKIGDGNVYQADIPDDSELLDWDKPLNEQSETVRERLGLNDDAADFFKWYEESVVSKVGNDYRWDNLTTTQRLKQVARFEKETGNKAPRSITLLQPGKVTGEDFYLNLALDDEVGGSYRDASLYLDSLGIPGLRYLDGDSRYSSGGEIIAIWQGDQKNIADKPTGKWFARVRRDSDGSKTSMPLSSKAEAEAWANNEINGGSYNYVIWDESRVTVEAVNDELLQAEAAASDDTAAFSRAATMDLPRAERQSEWAQENRRLREQDTALWQKAKTLLRKYFAPGGLLPESVFNEKIARDGKLGVVEITVQDLVRSLEDAIQKDYGLKANRMTENQMRKISDALAGKVTDQIRDNTRTAIVAMRQYMDHLSGQYAQMLWQQVQDMQAQGVSDDVLAAKVDLLNTIMTNQGEYVHRSYQVFDDPDWYKNVDESVVDNARQYLIRRYQEANPGARRSDAQARAEVILSDILKNDTAYDSMESFIKESKLGAKDLSILKRRKDIAPEIRALMGEYIDPRINFAKSATKMGRLIFNQKFLDKVREQGMGVFLFNEATRPPGTEQIAADGSEVYAPLNGLYTYKEVAQAMKDALGREQMSGWYKAIVQVNGMVKGGKTILSPTTSARNFQSAMFFSIANGHFDLTQARKSLALINKFSNQEKLAYVKKMKELGVIYDNPYAEEMMDLLRESRADSFFSDNRTAEAIRASWEFARDVYSFGDDFWKVIGFENEKAMLLKHTRMTVEQAEAAAADRIRNNYPTYSMVGKAIQWLRRFPLVGTFVSFPAEIIRTTFNMVKTVRQDWNTPGMRPIAARRALGMSMVAGFAYAAQEIAKAMFDVDDDDEEAIRIQAAPWQRNSNIVVTGRDDDGNLRYVDISFLDPYNYFKRPITAIMRDQPLQDSLVSAAADMLSPFFGTDIAAGALMEIYANKTSTGAAVFKVSDSVDQQLMDIADHLRKAVQPGIASNLERTYKAMSGERSPSGRQYNMVDEGLGWVGWRVSTLDPKSALYYRSFEFADAKAEATQTLSRVLNDPNRVTDQEIANAYQRSMRMRQQAYDNMIKLINASRKSGLSDQDIRDVLRASSVSNADAFNLLLGRMTPWQPTRQAEAYAYRRAQALIGVEQAEIIRGRYQQARTLN